LTTIVVVKKNGVAAIAGDTLTTFGNVRLAADMDTSSDKILQHKGSYLGIAGSAAHQLVIESILRRRPELSFHGRMQIFESFRHIHPVLKDEHFLNPKEEEDDPYESSQLTALIANSHGIFGVYSMREVFEYARYWAIGSGREFATGAMHACYDSAADAAEIARRGVEAGVAFDSGSSLPMTLYTIPLER
jgi:ATP-dependent HslUV protease, peptidase subunit HslV